MDQNLWTYRFLIDIWVEAREFPGLPRRVRARVRDLEQREATYVGSMTEIEAVIEGRLDHLGMIPRRWEREP